VRIETGSQRCTGRDARDDANADARGYNDAYDLAYAYTHSRSDRYPTTDRDGGRPHVRGGRAGRATKPDADADANPRRAKPIVRLSLCDPHPVSFSGQ
jgi:hypothetical protein